MSQRQRDDKVILAHIREQHRLSLESYGRPRMTEELQELGVNVGHRRVGRLMRDNGIKIIRRLCQIKHNWSKQGGLVAAWSDNAFSISLFENQP